MAYRELSFQTSSPTVTVQGGKPNATNKSPKTKIITKFRVLTNIRKLEKNEVLVVAAPEKDADGQGEAKATPKAEAAPTKAEPVAKRARR